MKAHQVAMNPYKAIRDAAADLGLPKFYRKDLLVHDRRALRNYAGPFIWCVRECGTHLLYLGEAQKANEHILSYVHSITRAFGAAKWFGFDGMALISLGTDYEIERFLERFKQSAAQSAEVL